MTSSPDEQYHDHHDHDHHDHDDHDHAPGEDGHDDDGRREPVDGAWSDMLQRRMDRLAGRTRTWTTKTGAEALYRPDSIVTSLEVADEVCAFLGERGYKCSVQKSNVAARINLPQQPDLVNALDVAIHGIRGARVGLNYLYRPTFHRMWGLVDPPEAVDKLEAPSGSVGEGVTIGVIDSGCWAGHPWWVDGAISVADRNGGPLVGSPDEEMGFEVDGQPSPEAGHGTFVVGTIVQHAPGAKIRVARTDLLHQGGDDFDVPELLLAFGDDVDIINLSLGTPTIDGQPPVGLDSALRLLAERRVDKPVIVVAAAGNDGHTEPMFPAADKRVLAVAATDGNGNAAGFSNTGGWVDGCALGVDVTSAFLEGSSRSSGFTYAGYASWSGTSFSAPRVTAALAGLLGQGRSPLEAVHELIRRPGLPMVSGMGVFVS